MKEKQSLFSQNGKSKPHYQQPPNAHNDEKESGRDMQKIEKKKQSRKHNQPDEKLREKKYRLRLKAK